MNGEKNVCPRCNGQGELVVQVSIEGEMVKDICTRCEGTGKLNPTVNEIRAARGDEEYRS